MKENEEREGREEKRSQAEFNTQEKKGPHCGPRFSSRINPQVLFESTGRGKSKSVELEDVKFHQCVRLSRFENDRTISFIPPDGEFELMSYRLAKYDQDSDAS